MENSGFELPKYEWSKSSLKELKTVDPRLQLVFNKALELGVIDIRIIEGHRDEDTQEEMVRQRKSHLHWPNSKHNTLPSKAIDAIPLPFNREDWNNSGKFGMFTGFILGVGASLDIKLRVGFDWNGNFDPTDNWIDAPHFELVED
jgi:hypothetical protein